jgi:hypothetical protein
MHYLFFAHLKRRPEIGAKMQKLVTFYNSRIIWQCKTMTAEKKTHAVNGNKLFQHEWMIEEVNEFYEAIYLEDIDEIRDEAIGLIRTFQQFQDSKRVASLKERMSWMFFLHTKYF